MTPLDFSRWYEGDERSFRDQHFRSGALEVNEGERVGVVLMNIGGPESLDHVGEFLYNLFMDPVLFDLPVSGRLRHWICKALASWREEPVRQQYELIGGSSPLPRLTEEQAGSLEERLNEHFGTPTGVDFRTYVSMRYSSPCGPDTASRMADDGVDRVVLLPLYPQYSKALSGSALAYWKALEETGEIPSWPTTTAFEYAANPKYVRALSERIDEGLQRFPQDRRDDVELLFSAPGTLMKECRQHDDPYCCLVHSTVEQVMRHRGRDRSAHTAFQNRIPLRQGLIPPTETTIDHLADQGTEAVLVVPLTFTTDHLLTSYELDIGLRERAEAAGIRHYEVTSGMNTHPLFIEALSEATIAQLDLPVDVNQLRVGGDGLSQEYPLRPIDELPRYNPDSRSASCECCSDDVGARRWTVSSDAPDSEIVSTGTDRKSSEQSS